MSDGNSQAYADMHEEKLRNKEIEKFISHFPKKTKDKFLALFIKKHSTKELKSVVTNVNNDRVSLDDTKKIHEILKEIIVNDEQREILSIYFDDTDFHRKVFFKLPL